MDTAKAVLDRQFYEMRARVLSLAADMDRVGRGLNADALADDPRLVRLREAMGVTMGTEPDRAARVQMLFSDQTPPPGT